MRSTTSSPRALFQLCLPLFLILGCDTHVRNLGGGFKLVRDQRPASSASAPAPTHHLYYDAKDLGSVGQYFISPSGCHALYEQNGKLMLFHSCSESLKPVSELNGAVAKQITWSESRNEARVAYSAGKSITVIPLSACACHIESRPLARNK